MPVTMLHHVGIPVDDLEAACAKVEATGCEIEVPISPRPDGTLYFFFDDPEGNRVELCRH